MLQHFKDLIRLRRTAEWPRSTLDAESTTAKEAPEVEPLPFTLSHERCISVVQKLALFLLSMDFTCHADLLLFVCKVFTAQPDICKRSVQKRVCDYFCIFFRCSLELPMLPDLQSTCVRWCLSSSWNVFCCCLWGPISIGGTSPGVEPGPSILWHVWCRTSWQVCMISIQFVLIYVSKSSF